jgi:thiol-disulfide isomerase/thioredoxin
VTGYNDEPVVSVQRQMGEWQWKGRGRWIMAGLVGVCAVTCAALWPQTTSLPTNGLPVLLEVPSPYCLGCVAQKPAVDKLEQELAGRLTVRRGEHPERGRPVTPRAIPD